MAKLQDGNEIKCIEELMFIAANGMLRPRCRPDRKHDVNDWDDDV
jgi:hypothetical protein